MHFEISPYSECFDGCPCEGSGNEYCSAPVNLVLLKPYNIFGGEHKDYLWSWDGPERESVTEFSQSELAPYRSCSYMVQNRMFLAGSQAGLHGLFPDPDRTTIWIGRDHESVRLSRITGCQ